MLKFPPLGCGQVNPQTWILNSSAFQTTFFEPEHPDRRVGNSELTIIYHISAILLSAIYIAIAAITANCFTSKSVVRRCEHKWGLCISGFSLNILSSRDVALLLLGWVGYASDKMSLVMELPVWSMFFLTPLASLNCVLVFAFCLTSPNSRYLA